MKKKCKNYQFSFVLGKVGPWKEEEGMSKRKKTEHYSPWTHHAIIEEIRAFLLNLHSS